MKSFEKRKTWNNQMIVFCLFVSETEEKQTMGFQSGQYFLQLSIFQWNENSSKESKKMYEFVWKELLLFPLNQWSNSFYQREIWHENNKLLMELQSKRNYNQLPKKKQIRMSHTHFIFLFCAIHFEFWVLFHCWLSHAFKFIIKMMSKWNWNWNWNWKYFQDCLRCLGHWLWEDYKLLWIEDVYCFLSVTEGDLFGQRPECHWTKTKYTKLHQQ
jgi:hypothetical protein